MTAKARHRRTVDDWRREVFRAKALPDSAKVLLLWMADKARRTNSGLVVCEPRPSMAAALAVSERRIDERLKAGRESGHLVVVRPGYRGHVAEYALTFPSQSARETVAHTGQESASPTSALSMSKTVAHSKRESARETVAPLVSTSAPLTACEPCGGYGCANCCGEAAS